MKRSTLCLAQGVVLPTPIGMNHGNQQRRLITTFFKVTEITMEDNKMTFGKYKGQHIELLPVEYLAWAARSMKGVPRTILNELERRAAKTETKDAIIASDALIERSLSKPKRQTYSKTSAEYWYEKARNLNRPRSRRRRAKRK